MEKDCPLAEKIFSRILGSSSSDPSLPGALFYMAECERKEQRRDLSDPHYLEVIRKYPNSIFAKRAGEILEPSH
jgi:TolA-binding protein